MLGCRLQCDLAGGQAIDTLDQLNPGFGNPAGIFTGNGADIGLIDQSQIALGAAEPHRHWRGLDQPDQSSEIIARPCGFVAQLHQFALAVGKVEYPDQRRAAGRDLRIGQVTAQRQASLGPARRGHHPERRRSSLAAAYRFGQFMELFGGQPAAAAVDTAAVELGQELRDLFQPQPVGQPLRRLDLAVDPHQQWQGRTFVNHPRQPPGMAHARFCLPFPPPRGDHRDQRSQRPGRQQQPEQSQRGWSEGHGFQLCARGPDYNRIAHASCGLIGA